MKVTFIILLPVGGGGHLLELNVSFFVNLLDVPLQKVFTHESQFTRKWAFKIVNVFGVLQVIESRKQGREGKIRIEKQNTEAFIYLPGLAS